MSIRRSLALLILAAPAAFFSGCSSPGGQGFSSDRFVYQSNEWQPWTVSLIDTRTGESLWSVDVPVGKQLVMGFRKGVGPNEFKPDMMYWGISENGRNISRQSNQFPVPGAHARRIEPVLRPTPELPGTPLPGSPYAATTNVNKTEAAAKGKMEPGSADLFAPAQRGGPKPIEVPKQEPAHKEEVVPSPTQPEPVTPVSEPTPAQDPPVDLPQGDTRPSLTSAISP